MDARFAVTPGLTLNATSGLVAGTPSTAAGSNSYTYNVTVADSKAPPETATGSGTLQIAAPLQISTALDPVYVNTPFLAPLVASGGFFPYTWTIISGNLPTGLSLSSDGILSGTTSQLGAYPLTLQITDSLTPPVKATQAVTLHVTPTPVNILGNPISPAPVNVLYHSQVPVSGGTPPYTFSLPSGSLPPGLTLDPATGNIDGTPTQIGTYNFSPLATDSTSPPQTGTANDFIQVTKALGRNDSHRHCHPTGKSIPWRDHFLDQSIHRSDQRFDTQSGHRLFQIDCDSRLPHSRRNLCSAKFWDWESRHRSSNF